MADAPNTAAPAATTPQAQPAAKGSADAKGAPAAADGAKTSNEPLHTIKVNGKERQVTQSQLIALAQKGAFADEKLRSVDVLQGRTAALLSKLKEDPLAVLSDPALGISRQQIIDRILASDADDATKEKLSKWVYDNVVAQAKKTPEQIETEKKLAELERLKKAEAERKQKELTAQQQAQVQQVYAAVRAEVTKQIVADKTFPQVEGSIRQVIDKLRVMNKKGAPLTPENVTKAIGLVKKDHVLHQQALLDAVEDPESLVALIGEERAMKISRALVARVKAKQKAAEKKSEEKPEPRKKVTDAIDEKLGRAHGYKILNF